MADEVKKIPPVVGKFRLREKCGTHTEIAEGGVYFVQPGQVVEGRSKLDKRFPEKFEAVDSARKVTAAFIPNGENGQPQSIAEAGVQQQLAEAPKTPSSAEADLKEAEATFKTYETMTLAELKAQAVEDEVDLGSAKSKADVLEAFKVHLGLVDGDEEDAA